MRKPPIGLKPLWIHNEERFKEVCDAIKRYEAADKEIPEAWVIERLTLCGEILKQKNKTMDNNKDFVWTDELVLEFVRGNYTGNQENDNINLNGFKQSKQPKKEWEILSYLHNGVVFKKNFLNEFIGDFDLGLQHLILHPEERTTIHSVKRISDGEVFTVGDKVKYTGEKCSYAHFIIREFFIGHDGKMLARSKEAVIVEYLEEIKKIKQPLFKTEDGVDIYEGDEYILVDNLLQIFRVTKWFNYMRNEGDKFFSTEEAAKGYINKHKPKYSEAQLLDCWNAASNYTLYSWGKITAPTHKPYPNQIQYIESLNK